MFKKILKLKRGWKSGSAARPARAAPGQQGARGVRAVSLPPARPHRTSHAMGCGKSKAVRAAKQPERQAGGQSRQGCGSSGMAEKEGAARRRVPRAPSTPPAPTHDGGRQRRFAPQFAVVAGPTCAELAGPCPGQALVEETRDLPAFTQRNGGRRPDKGPARPGGPRRGRRLREECARRTCPKTVQVQNQRE